MDPIVWSSAIVEHLERDGVVGCLLPRGAQDAGDRYQPYKLFVDYAWVGDRSAATVVEFRVDSAEARDAIALERDGWAVSSRVDREGWGEKWAVCCTPCESFRVNYPNLNEFARTALMRTSTIGLAASWGLCMPSATSSSFRRTPFFQNRGGCPSPAPASAMP